VTRSVRDERGQSVSVFVVLVSAAIMMTAGLVVDGGQQVTAASRAEAAAAGAARAAGNAAATQALAGSSRAATAVTAAQAYLAGQPGVRGRVSLDRGIVSVSTTSSAPTLFLSVVGIDTVTGQGSAQANLVATGQVR
jgi:Mn2+/Fe2+ NRAMP family transporter